MSSHAALEAYYRRIEAEHLSPLWERLADLLPAEPRVRARPHLWRYGTSRPILLESAELIDEGEAERRVLILENPGLVGESAVTETLFAGLQVIMPGEIARPHRHTPAALRFVLEGGSAYTSVDDERVAMQRGDLILTPSWVWHGHANKGTAPVVWLDVLDLPAVRALGPRFAERSRRQPPDGAAGGTANTGGGASSSALRYPYDRARDALERLSRHTELDVVHGFRKEYTDPGSGRSLLPSISAFLQLLPSGFSGQMHRTTENLVYCVSEGRGRVRIDGADVQCFEFGPEDVFAVPCWYRHALAADEETVLFSASDRAVQMRLGLWRERSAAAPHAD